MQDFQYIINPNTNRRCRVSSRLGKQIIKNYIKISQLGGVSKEPTEFQWGKLIKDIFDKTDEPYWVYTGPGDQPFSKETVIQKLKNSYRLTADEKKHVEEFVNKTWGDLAGASIESLEDLFIQQWIHYKKVYSPIPE